MARHGHQPLRLRKAGETHVIATRTTIASRFMDRFLGLMGRSQLADRECLYLPGTNGVHMLFMRFAIDCLFLGEQEPDGCRPVVALRERLPPWRGVVWYVRGARGVVELPEGSIAAAGLEVGDKVRFDEPGAATP